MKHIHSSFLFVEVQGCTDPYSIHISDVWMLFQSYLLVPLVA